MLILEGLIYVGATLFVSFIKSSQGKRAFVDLLLFELLVIMDCQLIYVP